MPKHKKIVVFDLDETLGYFSELGLLWSTLQSYFQHQKKVVLFDQNLFNLLLDLYPQFIRPNIFDVLAFVKRQVHLNNCKCVYIYTNNRAPYQWSLFIKTYFEQKLGYSIFCKIIGANHEGRTTCTKTIGDFINCTNNSNSSSYICYIDNTYYPRMKHCNLVYIHIQSYIYHIPCYKMVDTLMQSKLYTTQLMKNVSNNTQFKTYMQHTMESDNLFKYCVKTHESFDNDITVGDKLMVHLVDFFDRKLFPRQSHTCRFVSRKSHRYTVKHKQY